MGVYYYHLFPLQAQNNHEFVQLLDNHGASIELVSANIVHLYQHGCNLQHLNRYLWYVFLF